MEREDTPMISVIMGIYNCESTLEEAIRCILDQTVQDWELILCDDGSTDGTYTLAEKLRAQSPGKIVLLKNESNRGLSHALNRCLAVARGRFIARMDGDDRCASDRFEKELAVFQADETIDIVSTDMEHFDASGIWGRNTHPTEPQTIDFLHGTPFCHAPCMVRREAFDSVGGYSEDPRVLRVEDYDLWTRMYMHGFRGKNIHEALYQMRDDRDAFRRRSFSGRIRGARAIAAAIRELNLPLYGYLFALRPILVGLLPAPVYMALHKWKLRS